jgi:hypothetical protein
VAATWATSSTTWPSRRWRGWRSAWQRSFVPTRSPLTLLPGFTRTEAVLALYTGDLAPTHSTQYVGRAVAVLAGDPEVMRHSGESLRVADVAEAYGFVDVDGRWVPPFELPE